ncbi:MAG: DUF4832 domain-containing protein [Paludibacter sp.]
MKSILTTIFTFIVFICTAQNITKFSPVVIPVSDTEILNPGRGLAHWQQKAGIPFPTIDHYQRYRWSDLEKSQGVYDFSLLKAEAEIAKTDPDGRGLYGLAVRCLDSGVDHCYPTYIDGLMSSWYSAKYKCWVPDWNDPQFLERQDSLVANLGRVFNNDERVGYVEIRSFGNWGEWHISGFETPPSPAIPITKATIQHMIDTYIKAFPDKQIIMLNDEYGGLEYAMTKTDLKYPIGWRRDSWPSSIMDYVKKASTWTKVSDRWKIAPVIIESIETKYFTFSSALPQVVDYHVSSIGGNLDASQYYSYTAGFQDTLVNCIKYSGYRYIVRSISYPDVFVPGQTINLKSEWSNVGVAPIYRDWKVSYRITNQITGALVLEIPSALDLRKLLPTYSHETKVDIPVLFDDSFVLPASFVKGNYNLEVIVSDPINYLSPLKLAIQGRKTTGAYGLGTVLVDTQSAINELTLQNDFFLTGVSNSEIKLTFQTAGIYSYAVYNLEGKPVLVNNMNFNISDQYIDIYSIPKGFYILKIVKGNNSKSIRFVK